MRNSTMNYNNSSEYPTFTSIPHEHINAPPTHLTADYIEMGYLGIMITLGVPLNIYVLDKLYRQAKLQVRV